MTTPSDALSSTGAPAVVAAGSLKSNIRVEPLTCAIGAELSNVSLGAASRDPALVAEIRSLLLKYRVLRRHHPRNQTQEGCCGEE